MEIDDLKTKIGEKMLPECETFNDACLAIIDAISIDNPL